MNLLFVNATRRWGGVRTWTLDLAQWLRRQGHGVHLVVRPGPFAHRARDLGLAVTAQEFGIDFNPRRIGQLLRLIRQERMDAVIANVGKDLTTGGVAARLAGIPLVHRLGLPRDMDDSLKNRLLHRALRPHILVPSQDTRAGLLATLPWLDPQRVTAIHTGKRPADQPPAQVHQPRRLMVTSQLNPDKGHAGLFQALARLQAAGRDFHLTICGTGSAEPQLRQLAQSLELAPRLTWLGFQANVRAVLAEADIFVLNSRSEGLPNSLLEAMAAGLAPVARDVGGVREVWPEALAPLWAGAPDDTGGLDRALDLALTADDACLLGWKTAAWQACRERFDLDTQAARILTWLQGLRP